MKFRLIKLFIIIAAAFCCRAQNYTIATIAGQGLALGDGGPAANANFGAVSAVALGPDGSLYIADSIYHQVRRITPDGNISLFAGGPVRGYGGDGGPATSALLNSPTALVVDSGGNVYIGDSGNHRVRLVTIFGNIQTIAGNGQVPPSPSDSLLPGEGGPATAAPLNQISGLAFASNGDLIVSDFGNNRIFRVSSGNITTVAGNAASPASLASQPAKPATLGGPTGLATDLYGNIYFSELTTDVVRMIDARGNLTVLIGTGPGSQPVASGNPLSYPLVQPVGMASDSSFNMYILEAGRVSMYSPFNPETGSAATVQTIAGNLNPAAGGTGDGGSPLSAGMNPRSLAVDSLGNIYLADSLATLSFNNRVRMISSYDGTISTLAGGNFPTGTGDGGSATAAQLYFPQAMAISPSGTVYIADTGDNRIRAVTPDGKINTVAGSNIDGPAGLALDSQSNLYVTDGASIREVNPAGAISTFAVLPHSGSLAIDSQNDVYVDQLAQVSEVPAGPQMISTAVGDGTPGYSGDGGTATAAQIGATAGVAVDAAGNLFIADGANGRVREVSPTGVITTFAGGGTATGDGAIATSAMLNNPAAVAVDKAGNVFIAESSGNRIRVVGSDGSIHTIAGNGLQGFGGDGAVATSASLNNPSDVKVDAQGNIYIVDSLNSSIRKLTALASRPTPAISLISNAGSDLDGPVAPGERVVIVGTALGPGSQVMFDAYPAPVLNSSATSTLAVVPYEVASQTSSQVTVITNGVSSAPFTVQIALSAPGIFTLSSDGQGQAYAIGQDGELNSADDPVVGGTVISILCTGEGVVSPAAMTGVPIGSTPPSPVLPVTATIDGEDTMVNQAYSAPGTIGQFIVDLVVPDDASSDPTATVVIMVGNAASQNSASIAVVSDPNQGDGGDGGDGSDMRKARRGKSAWKPGPAATGQRR